MNKHLKNMFLEDFNISARKPAFLAIEMLKHNKIVYADFNEDPFLDGDATKDDLEKEISAEITGLTPEEAISMEIPGLDDLPNAINYDLARILVFGYPRSNGERSAFHLSIMLSDIEAED